ncbi:MAG TPA: alpha-L-fucosidase [Allosphingosinicella sp.]|nr:alpha-L-fucosidase [Allosphingosinicella sp.]
MRRRDFLIGTAAAATAAAAPPIRGRNVSAGPFASDWESLAAGYRAPDWFRDAKFGIWAHWGPQCVPEAGDWYARLMYLQGSPAYGHHLEHYGHPADTGFLDVIGRWKAEAWDPDALVQFYKENGARYFVALANHHDNFDCYASSYHGWNSLRVGPKRDLVGGWARAARKAGLRFGVSNHSAHAWHWYQPGYGYDPLGPRRGVRYDAFRLRPADGRGTWWSGLDPQELYTGPSFVIPDGVESVAAMEAWHGARDGQWLETPPPAHPAFAAKWLARCTELTDRYDPDLLYFDDTGLPLERYGLEATAHYYNRNMARRGGTLEAVVTGKQLSDRQRRGIVEDVERGFSDRLRTEPWQTDTCIGDWHYNRARFEQHSYVPARAVVQRLCDTVSKNGNLLLSVPVRGDGSIDGDERRIVSQIGAWLGTNGEAIYGSRAWRRFGEGPTKPAAGMLNEGQARPFTSRDIRFTTGEDGLYAIALDAPPGGVLRVESLGRDGAGPVESVELLGGGQLLFRQQADALLVEGVSGGALGIPVLRVRGA